MPSLSSLPSIPTLSYVAHTPDNSFLGFVVGSDQMSEGKVVKKNQSLVYGKELYMWKVGVVCMIKWVWLHVEWLAQPHN